MLSIIIIAKNEERYLPQLLESIKIQDFKDYEVILSDASSTDKTLSVAKRFGCKIVKGGLPSVGRNNGAKKAKGELLLFLDADVTLPENFLSENISEFEARSLVVAGCYLNPRSSKFSAKIYTKIANFFFSFLQYVSPNVFGVCILCSRGTHKKIKGFDDSIVFAEDSDYVCRASKHGRFRMLNSKKINYSVRRFEEEGYLRTQLKYIFVFLYRIFFGEVRSDIFNYRFAHYKQIYKQKSYKD